MKVYEFVACPSAQIEDAPRGTLVRFVVADTAVTHERGIVLKPDGVLIESGPIGNGTRPRFAGVLDRKDAHDYIRQLRRHKRIGRCRVRRQDLGG